MSPRFFLAEAWRSIRANAAVSVAATVTVLIAVFILGAFIPSFLYVQSTVDSQKEKVDIDAFISDSATVPQVEGLRTQLVALQSNGQIREFTYVSKDDALTELRARLKDPSILEELPSNPLPAKFNIKPTDPDNAQGIIDQISDSPAIDPELGISYGKETADKLLSVARFIQWAGLGLITILLVASILLIGNTIRLSIFARRREVEVMKLVGATNWFIRWPFVIEGIICGLVGAILSVALLWAVKVGVVDQWIQDADSALTRDQATTIGFPLLGLILIASGGLVGALGSGITLRRFLKV
ncbi:MAG TPA: permease-like cell division protein FtsX [Miltoncostaeaceae bacterium]|nr:permease-like cell division protein FtsX [Miltoncostaeaceae bacterium]